MKLYEVNEALSELLNQLEANSETGEVADNFEEICTQIECLQVEKKRILEWLAREVLNVRSDVVALKSEEDRLKVRRKSLETKEERLLAILDRECNGQKTDCGVATFSYRRGERVEITDSDAAIASLEGRYEECLKRSAPEINKIKVKELIKSGETFDGIEIAESITYNLR